MIKGLEEITSYIIDRIAEGKSIEEIEEGAKKLKGYDKVLVATIYSWVFDKVLSNLISEKIVDKKDKSIRFLSDDEMRSIGKENYEKLLKFNNLGLLSWDEINIFIEQLAIFGDIQINTRDFNLLLMASLFDLDKYTPQGSRMLLYISDKIN